MPYCTRLMCQGDVNQVTEIDREAFPTILPPANFQRELYSPLAHYIVACGEEGKTTPPGAEIEKSGKQYIVGFAGFWIMSDEAHIVNFAVRQSYHRQGVGELLLIYLIELAMEMKASLVTLEVRVSNTIARELYSKYGFTDRELKRGYYSDNKDDAVIMTVDDINSSLYQIRLKRLKKAYSEKWGASPYQIVR